MSVRELIEKLQKLPESTVNIYNKDYNAIVDIKVDSDGDVILICES